MLSLMYIIACECFVFHGLSARKRKPLFGSLTEQRYMNDRKHEDAFEICQKFRTRVRAERIMLNQQYTHELN